MLANVSYYIENLFGISILSLPSTIILREGEMLNIYAYIYILYQNIFVEARI